MRYDVIVVGAGPAGSTTARECAERGLKVLLLDKAEFPRDKPCGGGITIHAANMLPFDLGPVVEREVNSLRLTVRQKHEFARHSPERLTILTQRRHLDAYLLERALDASVTLRQRAPIREVTRFPRHVVVRAGQESFEGRTLVAADGANGQTAKLAGLELNLSQGVALEGNVTPDNGFPDKWEDAIGLDMGCIPGGYGWIFPKGDHLNVGIGGWQYTGPSLRSRLDGLVRFYGFDPQTMWGVRGHHLPLRNPGSPLADGNVVLVGDAAGLIDPLTGEGIASAFSSGRIAANQLAAYLLDEVDDLQGYARDVERDLLIDLRVARQFHDIFHLSPAFYLAVERWSSVLWKGITSVLLGRQSYAGLTQKLGPLWPVAEFLVDLIRITPFLQRMAGLQDPSPTIRYFRGSAERR